MSHHPNTRHKTALVIRNIILALVASSAMAVALAGTGSAVAAPSEPSTELIYQISNMPAGSSLDVVYTGGVTSNSNGFAQSRHGGFRTVAFQRNYAVSVDAAASGGALYGNVSEWLGVSGPVITGVAVVPDGATVKLLNPDTDQTIDLPSGPFTIDATPTTSVERLNTSEESVRCQGKAASCKAMVAIGGEAQKRRVTVDLAHPSMSLASVSVDPPSDKAGFNLSDGRFSDDGQRYTLTVNTLEAEPSNTHLVLTFADPARR